MLCAIIVAPLQPLNYTNKKVVKKRKDKPKGINSAIKTRAQNGNK